MNDFIQRKPNRCPSWDYSSNGSYFITLCTENKKCILGKAVVGDGVLDVPEVILSEYGKICRKQLEEMNEIYKEVKTAKYIIMPNHIHLIVTVDFDNGTSRTPSPTNEIIPSYMSTFKRFTNRQFGTDIWERSYYDRIIRSEKEYSEIWQYIDSNAAKWKTDCFYYG